MADNSLQDQSLRKLIEIAKERIERMKRLIKLEAGALVKWWTGIRFQSFAKNIKPEERNCICKTATRSTEHILCCQ
jgi:hypothetical protein